MAFVRLIYPNIGNKPDFVSQINESADILPKKNEYNTI